MQEVLGELLSFNPLHPDFEAIMAEQISCYCPLSLEADQVSLVDAFWSDLELLWGGLGDHFSSLFGAGAVF